MATFFKNFQKKTVFVSTTRGHTFRIGPGETKKASPAVAEDCLRAGLAPVEGAEELDGAKREQQAAEAAAKAEKESVDAEEQNAAALAAAAEKAKRSAAAKKAAATRKAKSAQ